eukprot:TRINITY_DN4445_c0_g1_i1.p1 TRINITY_DN4445_c0_g1~~TRINITY_DN4445_c0_g1_i1.p1  ORF type:complete len:3299 (+),score=1042.55 TRINITY_DN4445_c0_g1_i1:722-9898(+)
MVPRTDIEPQLRRLEELQSEVQRSRLAVRQAQDMTRVCASQVENYEQLVKRRQHEIRNLQETVKLMQASDEMSNQVGKLQYRLMLSQWEKSNAQRQLQSAAQELKLARKDLLDNEEEMETDKKTAEDEVESLQHRLTIAREAAEKYKEQATASLPIDKARELTSKVEEISKRKTELEDKLLDVRRHMHRNQSEMDGLKLQAQQAQGLLEEMSTFDKDSEAPRARLLEMAKKLSDSKLLEMRHKRDLEMSQEQYEHLKMARQTDAKTIEVLQKEIAQAETKLATEAERWRERILEAQQLVMQRAIVPEDGQPPPPPGGDKSTTGAAGGAGATGGSSKAQPLSLRRASKQTVQSLEQVYERLVEKDAKISEMESVLQKTKEEKDHIVAEERMKVRKLELELNLINQNDTVKLRQTLRAEHDAEMKQISEAAQESVNTLQTLIDQAEARLGEREQEIRNILQSKQELTQKHMAETTQLQQEVSNLRQEIIKVKHEYDMHHSASPKAGHHFIDLNMSMGSELGEHGVEGQLGSVEERLEHSRQRVITLEASIMAMQEEFQSTLQAQELEAQRHAERLHSEYHARIEQRERDYHAVEDEYRRLLGSAEGEAVKHRDVATKGGEEAMRHYELAVQHESSAQMHRLNAERLQKEVERLRVELVDKEQYWQQKLEDQMKDNTLRKQQVVLKRQLVTKEEQLGKFKKAIDDLKEKVIQLTMDRENNERSNDFARQADVESKRRMAAQEDRVQAMKEQVARLTRQLQEQKEKTSQEANKTTTRGSGDKEMEQLLDEASQRLAEKAEEAARAETAAARYQRRAEEAESALTTERLVLQGEARLAKQEARGSAEANARRMTGLHKTVETLEAERNQLAARLHGLEVAMRGSLGAISPNALAEMQELLRREQLLREQLQAQVHDMAAQLELAHLGQTQPRGAASPSGSPYSSPMRGRSLQTAAFPHRTPSPSPEAAHLSAELVARCNQLQAEVMQLRARLDRADQEKDDLKLQVATGGGAAHDAEAEQLRASVNVLSSQNLRLSAEVERERARSREREEPSASVQQETLLVRSLQQQLATALQQLEAEKERARLNARPAGVSDLERLQAMDAMKAELEHLRKENLILRRDAVGLATTSTGAAAELTGAKEKVEELRRSVESLTTENLRLRRSSTANITAQLGTTAQLQVGGQAVEQLAQAQRYVLELQQRLEDLVQENSRLRRPHAAADMEAAATARRLQGLQAQVQELTRENADLRKAAGSAAAAAAPARASSDPRVGELQRSIEDLTKENLDLRRSNASALSQGGLLGAAGPAEVIALQQKNLALQAQVEQLQQDKTRLQLAGPSGSGAAMPSGVALGTFSDNNELAEVRRLHDENRAQRRIIEQILIRSGMGDAGSAFAALVEECQRLDRRLAAATDENIALRLKLPDAAKVAAGVFPALSAPVAGSLDELREANLLLRARFEAVVAEHAAAVRHLDETARRLEESVDEAAALRRHQASVGLTASATLRASAVGEPPSEVSMTFIIENLAFSKMSTQLQAVAKNSALRHLAQHAGVEQSAVTVDLSGLGSLAFDVFVQLKANDDRDTAERLRLALAGDAGRKACKAILDDLERVSEIAPAKVSPELPLSVSQPLAVTGKVARLEAELEKAQTRGRDLVQQLRAQTARVAELDADRETLRAGLREARARDYAMTQHATGATSDADRRQIRELTARNESLENELQQLRHWADRSVKQEAALGEHLQKELGADNEALQGRLAQLAADKARLQREVDDLKLRVDVPRPLPESTNLEQAAEIVRLKGECQELRKEKAKLMEKMSADPERRRGILETAKKHLEEHGVSFLQMLRVLDTQKLGHVPMAKIEASLRKLPTQLLPGSQLGVAVAESASRFLSSDGLVKYLDWLQQVLAEPPLSLAPSAGTSALCGFSLRTAFEIIDEEGAGRVSIATLKDAFAAFFDFLGDEDREVLINMLEPGQSNGQVHWMDCVWKLDMAFMVSRGQITALQASRKHAQDLVSGVPSGFNPIDALREYVARAEAAGQRAVPKRLFSRFDPTNTGFISKAAFRTILLQDVGISDMSEEEIDFFFEAVDTDGDDALSFREFELIVTGRDKRKEVVNMMLNLNEALRREGISPDDWVYRFDLDGSGKLDRREMHYMLSRLNLTLSEDEFNLLFSAVDTNQDGVCSLRELRQQLELSRVQGLIDDFKHQLRLLGIHALDAFLEADTDGSGSLTLTEFEALFLGRLRLNFSKAKLREMFDAFDRDGSGTVSYREFLQQCGLRSTCHNVGEREFLPPGDGPQWAERAFRTIKRAVARSKRQDRETMQAAREMMLSCDERESGALSPAELRRFMSSIGIDASQRDSERLCELLCAREPRRTRGGAQPKGQQRSGLGGAAAREARVDVLLARLDGVQVAEDVDFLVHQQVKPAAAHLQEALSKRSLSIVALLADLDPAQHGAVLFDAFTVAAARFRLGLDADMLESLRQALKVDKRGFFKTHALTQLVHSAEAEGKQARPTGTPAGAGGRATALEGLPPKQQASVQQSRQQQHRQRSRPAPGAGQAGHANTPQSATDMRHARQIDALNEALKKSEEDKARLQREVNELARHIGEAETAQQKQAAMLIKPDRDETGAKPLRVLLSAGDGVASFVKELKLEVRGTRDLRDKLFLAETELEECRRRLEVDARAEVEREQVLNKRLRHELEEKERALADLDFDLRRARAAMGESEWAQQEEEYMRLNIQNKKLEDEVTARKKTEAELAHKLLEQEHLAMELRFNWEQAKARTVPLENRILELELLLDGNAPTGLATGSAATVPPAAALAAKRERGLENVIEGLERVVTQQRLEAQRLKTELDGKRDDRKHRAEVERLKKKIIELESTASTVREDRRRTGAPAAAHRQAGHDATSANQLAAALEERDQRIAALEEQLLIARREALAAQHDASGLSGDGAATDEVNRLRAELQTIRTARSQDAMALDEAQRALEAADANEQRYQEVMRENRRLKADLSAFGDEGFWDEIETLQKRADSGAGLARESRATLERFLAAFPSMEPPRGLLQQLDQYIAAAAG